MICNEYSDFSEPKQNQQVYRLFQRTFYSFRFVTDFFGLPNNVGLRWAERGQIYHVLVNDRKYCPDWALAVKDAEKKGRKGIPCFLVRPWPELTFTLVCNTFESLVSALRQADDGKVCVSKETMDCREFVCRNLGLFSGPVFMKPSAEIVREILVKPPFLVESYFVLKSGIRISLGDEVFPEMVDESLRSVDVHKAEAGTEPLHFERLSSGMVIGDFGARKGAFMGGDLGSFDFDGRLSGKGSRKIK